MQLPPLSILVTWPAPNYVNPETRGYSLIILNSVLTGITFIVTVLRIYTRIYISHWYGLDDTFIIISMVLTIGTASVVTIGCLNYGWGRHMWDIPISMISNHLKALYAAQLLFNVASWTTLTSLLIFYYRLVRTAKKSLFCTAITAVNIFNLLGWASFLILAIYPCRPIRAFWTLGPVPNSKCLDSGLLLLVGGAVKTFTEILVATLPIPLILGLNLPGYEKIAVLVLLCLGYAATGAGAMRTYFTWKTFYDPQGIRDVTWYEFNGFVASAFELQLAVICACIPPLRPVFQPILGKAMGSIVSKVRSMASSRPSTKDMVTKFESDSANYTFFLSKNHDVTVPRSLDISSPLFLGISSPQSRNTSPPQCSPNENPSEPVYVLEPPVLLVRENEWFDNEDEYGREV